MSEQVAILESALNWGESAIPDLRIASIKATELMLGAEFPDEITVVMDDTPRCSLVALRVLKKYDVRHPSGGWAYGDRNMSLFVMDD